MCQLRRVDERLERVANECLAAADVGVGMVVGATLTEELRVEVRDARQRPRRAVGEVVRGRVQELPDAGPPQREHREVAVVVAGGDAGAVEPLPDRLPREPALLDGEHVGLGASGLRRVQVLAVRERGAEERRVVAVEGGEPARELRRERKVVTQVEARRVLVVPAAGREESAVALRAALVPTVAGIGVVAPAVRVRLGRLLEHVCGLHGTVRPRDGLVLAPVDAEVTPVAPPTRLQVTRGRRRAIRASGRRTGSPSSRRRRGRCRTPTPRSRACCVNRTPVAGTEGGGASAGTPAAPSPPPPCRRAARPASGTRVVRWSSGPLAPLTSVFLAAIYAIRQGPRRYDRA